MKEITPQSPSLKHWLIVLTGALFFFYQFIQMNMFNALSIPLMDSFHIDTTMLGYVSALFLLAIVLFSFPAGILTDIYSARSLLLLSLGLSTAGSFMMGYAPTLSIFAFGRLCTGIAHAFCFMNCIKLACQYFPPQRRAFITGLIVTIGMLGGVVSQTPLSLLLSMTTWQHAMQLNGLLGLALWCLFWRVIHDNDPEPTQTHQSTVKNFTTGFQHLITVMKNKQNWYAGLYTGLLNLPILVMGALWGNLYLTSKGLSHDEATLVCSMIYIGTIVGSPSLGWLSDYWQTKILPMKLGAITSIFVFMLILLLPTPSLTTLILLFFLLGFTSSAQVISYPLISASNPAPLIGSALSIASMLIMGAGMLFQPIVGALLDLSKNHAQHTQYQNSDFNLAFASILLCFIVALFTCYLLNEKQPVSHE